MGGFFGQKANHEHALAMLHAAVNTGSAAALAILSADDEDERVRRASFDVLRCVASASKGVYPNTLQRACKSLCARICELGLVTPSKGYDYKKEYEEAKDMSCPFSAIFWGALLEKSGCLHEAASCYQQAAARGFSAARYHFARCTWRGIGLQQNLKASFALMTEASDQGFIWAEYDAAVMLMGSKTLSDAQRNTDDKKAFVLFRKVAAKVLDAYARKAPRRCLYLQFCSCPNAHKWLALCYAEGRGVPQDLDQAAAHVSVYSAN